MTALSESRVQAYALDFLERYYRRRARRGRVAALAEARVCVRGRHGRADGLLVWRHWLTGAVQLASMEAKSHLTKAAIQPRFHFGQWLRNSLLAGSVVCALTGVYTFGYTVGGTWGWLLAFDLFVGSSVLYGLLSWRHPTHRQAPMMRQLRHYPAHYQWLAIPEGVFRRMAEAERRALQRLCRIEGQGLLLVEGRGRIRVQCKPKRRRRRGKHLLAKYACASVLMKEIG